MTETLPKWYKPGTYVDYQDCRWEVLWSDPHAVNQPKVCLRSVAGSETRVVPATAVRPEVHDGMMTRELFDKIMEEQG